MALTYNYFLSNIFAHKCILKSFSFGLYITFFFFPFLLSFCCFFSFEQLVQTPVLINSYHCGIWKLIRPFDSNDLQTFAWNIVSRIFSTEHWVFKGKKYNVYVTEFKPKYFLPLVDNQHGKTNIGCREVLDRSAPNVYNVGQNYARLPYQLIFLWVIAKHGWSLVIVSKCITPYVNVYNQDILLHKL